MIISVGQLGMHRSISRLHKPLTHHLGHRPGGWTFSRRVEEHDTPLTSRIDEHLDTPSLCWRFQRFPIDTGKFGETQRQEVGRRFLGSNHHPQSSRRRELVAHRPQMTGDSSSRPSGSSMGR